VGLRHVYADTQEPALPPLDNPFWQYSLRVYAAPGVENECLELQRALSIDVNVLLFCTWIGAARNVTLEVADIGSIDGVVRTWHETVVRPLRAVRQNLKTLREMAHDEVQALRREIATSELRAEQFEQALLFGWAEGWAARESAGPARDIVRRNVALFLKSSPCDGLRDGPPSPAALIDAALLVAAD
jgi:uncharacterized protein (TIGR02444 family)